MRKLFFLILILLSASKIFAEEPKKSNNSYSGVYITVGINYNSFSQQQIQQRLSSLGYEGFKIPSASGGFGLLVYNDSWLTYIAFNYGVDKEITNDITTRNIYKNLAINLGYDFIPHIKWSAYPYVGYRFDIYRFQYEKGIDSNLNMNQYYSQSTDVKEMFNNRSHLDMGIGISYQDLFTFTLRAGYALPITNSKWNTWNHRFEDSPKFRNQYYISFLFGIGLMIEHNNLRSEVPMITYAQ